MKALDKRYIAHFVVETASAMAIGSGEKGLIVDRLIARDCNDLPYIPGTSLAGVLRHELKSYGLDTNDLFGFQDSVNGQGSRVCVSDGLLVGEDGTVQEGLQSINFQEGFYAYFQKLPERDHVRITHRGSSDTKGHGKFDEELVFKGTRFVFEIEIEGTAEDSDHWKQLLAIIHSPTFRIGAGTRKGFGSLNIVTCHTNVFDLSAGIKAYLETTVSLNKDVSSWQSFNIENEIASSRLNHYSVRLAPENFYIFGAGFGDTEVDMTPKTERFFDWKSGEPSLSEQHILIPSTSVKGALSHRVAYYYNLLSGVSIDCNPIEFKGVDAQEFIASLAMLQSFQAQVHEITCSITSETAPSEALKAMLEEKLNQLRDLQKQVNDIDAVTVVEGSDYWDAYEKNMLSYLDSLKKFNANVGELNVAVQCLFGYAKNGERASGSIGKVLISDVYLHKENDAVQEKIFDHIAIDKFTGGGIGGALYQEKVVSSSEFNLDIYIEKSAFEDQYIQEAFEKALDDLVSGQLQLGGNTGKGHGAFTGSYQLLNEA